MILVSLLLVSIAVLCAAYYVYRVAFYSRKKGQGDVYAIPPGEQYQPHKSDMLSLIDKIVEREYVYWFGQKVHSSFSGLETSK